MNPGRGREEAMGTDLFPNLATLPGATGPGTRETVGRSASVRELPPAAQLSLLEEREAVGHLTAQPRKRF